MRRLAVLEVWVADKEETYGSSYSRPYAGGDLHRIMVDPRTDKQDAGFVAPVEKLAANVLAHELGHFVDYLSGGPTYTNSDIPIVFRSNSMLMAEETAAWDYAAKMTQVDLDIRDIALSTYKDFNK